MNARRLALGLGLLGTAGLVGWAIMQRDKQAMRRRIIDLARAELEQHADTSPERIAWYWQTGGLAPPYPPHWCGAFALTMIEHALAQYGVDLDWKIGWGFVGPEALPIVGVPEPGDVAYRRKWQHHAIVESVVGDVVTTIDGNQPGIKRRTHKLSDWDAYYSIEPLL